MADSKGFLYHLALNAQGYILAGAPMSPARKMVESGIVGAYPTEVDLQFKDSSQFLPWAQTDWSGGFQFEKWSDNAGFKKGTGLEYIAKYGELTLLNNDSSTLKDFGAGFTFGAAIEYNRDTVGLIIGVTKGSGASELWKMDTSDSFTAITGGTWANVDAVHDMDELLGKVYIGLTVSSGSPLKTCDGSTVADITLTGELSSSTIIRTVVRIKDRLYVGGYTGTAANGDALMYSDDVGATWTALITKTGTNRQIIQGVDNLGTLYFLIDDGNRTELWWCNDVAVTQLYRWNDLNSAKISTWLGKVYIEGLQNGKLMRFEWNGAVLRSVFEEKIASLDLDTSPAVVYENNLISYGLIFDGIFHFPSHVLKYTANKIKPFIVFGSGTAEVPYFYGLSTTNLIITKLNTSAYLTTGNVITGLFGANKPAVTKLWHSITVSFKALVSGQSIKFEYSVDDEGNWTEVDTIGVTASETEKTIYFANNVTSKRIQLRATLAGGGTNTPTLYDFVCRYLPLPENKFKWMLKLNCSDELKLLDGKSFEKKSAIELRNVLHVARFKNQIVALQDVDYAETLINDATNITAADTTITVDSTEKFPQQGRIKIGQEEILYTSKSAVAFLSCVRGARGTMKEVHLDNAAVHNAYNVIITEIAEENPVAPEAKTLESFVNISLREV